MNFDLKSIVIPIVTAVIAFAATFGGIKAEVNANTEKLRNTVTREEFKLLLEGQNAMINVTSKRLDSIEGKIDRLNERMIK